MLALLIAAQIAAPDPVHSERWLRLDDIPTYLIRDDGAWQVPLRVEVLPDGKVADCQAEIKGRLPKLDAHTCKIIRRRAKFRPAQIDGRPTHGVFRMTYNYFVTETAALPPTSSYADVQVVVNRLPDGLTSPTLVAVALVVDEHGEKSACAADETGRLKTIKKNDPALVPIACAEILKSYEARPARVAGSPILSVQNALVEFFAAKQSSDDK